MARPTTSHTQATMSSSAAAAHTGATAAPRDVSVENCSVIGFQALLRNAGIPCNGFDAAAFPGSRWHRVTISSVIDYDTSTHHRTYCRLGYAWLPVEWTSQKVQTSLMTHYCQSFALEDDTIDAHRRVSESLATSSPRGDHRTPGGGRP